MARLSNNKFLSFEKNCGIPVWFPTSWKIMIDRWLIYFHRFKFSRNNNCQYKYSSFYKVLITSVMCTFWFNSNDRIRQFLLYNPFLFFISINCIFIIFYALSPSFFFGKLFFVSFLKHAWLHLPKKYLSNGPIYEIINLKKNEKIIKDLRKKQKWHWNEWNETMNMMKGFWFYTFKLYKIAMGVDFFFFFFILLLLRI